MSKPKFEKPYVCVSEAIYRNAPMSARKARLVADLVRGKNVHDAINLLAFTYKPSAQPAVLNTLKSAIANAKVKKANVEELVVSEIFVDVAGMFKRPRPAPMGRVVRIRKRSCHITVRLNYA